MEPKVCQLSLDDDIMGSWRAIGSSENLLRDNDIAKLLLSVYYSVKQNGMDQSGDLCSHCRTPLALYCTTCQRLSPLTPSSRLAPPFPISSSTEQAPASWYSRPLHHTVCPEDPVFVGHGDDGDDSDDDYAKFPPVPMIHSNEHVGSTAPPEHDGGSGPHQQHTTVHGVTSSSNPDIRVKVKVEVDAVVCDGKSAQSSMDQNGNIGSVPARKRKRPGRFCDSDDWASRPTRKTKKNIAHMDAKNKHSTDKSSTSSAPLCTDKTLKVFLSRCDSTDTPDEGNTPNKGEGGVQLSRFQRQHARIHVYSDNFIDERTAEESAPKIHTPRKRIRFRGKKRPGWESKRAGMEGNMESTQGGEGGLDTGESGVDVRSWGYSRRRGRHMHILESERTVGSLKLPSGKILGYSWFQCVHCKLAFKRKSSFNQHVQSHASANSGESDFAGDKVSPRSASQTGPHICPVCGKSYNLKTSLHYHMNSHRRPEDRFPCDLCGALFNLERNVLNHKKRKHPEGASLKCKRCDFSCASQKDMKKHQKKHERQVKVQCEYCGVYLTCRPNLMEHILLHKGEKPHPCSHCERTFRTVSQLNAHIKGHHGELERPFRCDQCGRGFIKKDTLKHHMYSHTGEKPHKCTICPSVFARKDYLQKHMRTHTGEKPYSCSLCEQKFAFPGSLKLHKLKCHGIEVKTEQEDRSKLVSIDTRQLDVHRFDFLQPGVLLPFYPAGESDLFFRETIVTESTEHG